MNKDQQRYFIKEIFDQKKGSDADYLLIVATEYSDRLELHQLGWTTIPCDDHWETIEEAIEKIDKYWKAFWFYDLYAPFDFALVQTFKRQEI